MPRLNLVEPAGTAPASDCFPICPNYAHCQRRLCGASKLYLYRAFIGQERGHLGQDFDAAACPDLLLHSTKAFAILAISARRKSHANLPRCLCAACA
jgi:hypothetical protein